MDSDVKSNDGKIYFFPEQGCRRCTIIGEGVPVPTPGSHDIVRIGTGNVYLEIEGDGSTRVVGASGDEAVEAVLAGIKLALNLNPDGRFAEV